MSLRDALRIRESEVTDEAIYRDRRRLLQAFAAAPALALAGCAEAEPPAPEGRGDARTGALRLPHHRNADALRGRHQLQQLLRVRYRQGRPVHGAQDAQDLALVGGGGGECAKPGTLSLEDLVKGLAPEERIYRLRCVEGWSMVIPWLGVPLADVLKKFAPTSKAKYVAFTTLADRAQMPGVRYRSINWPYREGLRIDEAMHPLTLLATGLYGKPLPQQNGAPLRLVVPWKYGFKSIKSIVEIKFVERMPETAWHDLQPSEYGFFSNVNPNVDHPRWSQKTERRIAGTQSKLFAERIPTRMFNGYGDQVASLYAGMDLKKWY